MIVWAMNYVKAAPRGTISVLLLAVEEAEWKGGYYRPGLGSGKGCEGGRPEELDGISTSRETDPHS